MSSNAADDARQHQTRTRLESRLAAAREAQAAQLQHTPPAAAHPQAPLSPAQICPVDWLAHAFTFLPLKEHPLLMRACRSWRAAAVRVPSLGVEVDAPASRWPELSASPLRHHVSKLSTFDHRLNENTGHSCADVAWLHRLPALADLTSRIRDPALSQAVFDPSACFKYPPTLQHLHVYQHGQLKAEVPQWSVAGQQLVLSAISRLSRLESLRLVGNLEATHVESAAAIPPLPPFPHSLQKLQVIDTSRGRHAAPSRSQARRQQLVDEIGELSQLAQLTLITYVNDIEFTPLLRVTSLSSLHLLYEVRTRPSQMLSVVRQLDSLVDLELGFCAWQSDMLAELCAAPHTKLAKLQRVELGVTNITLAHMQQLVKLPSLTELRPCSFSPDALPLLADLSNLQELDVRLPPGESLGAHLIGLCPQLTEVRLVGVELRAAHLQMLGEQMPQLLKLTLMDCPLPDGLASLSYLTRLQTLTIVSGWASHLPSLLTLRLPSLTALTLWVPAHDRAAREEQLRQAREDGQLPALEPEKVHIMSR